LLVEPLMDLMSICGSLVESNGVISVPHFYDKVRPISDTDRVAIKKAAGDNNDANNKVHESIQTVKSKKHEFEKIWQQPSLSVKYVKSPNPEGLGWRGDMNQISTREKILLSCRFVPDQTADEIFQQLKIALEFQFARRRSTNKMEVTKVSSWEWWEADTSSEVFMCAEKALRTVWKQEPLRMRAGATLPVVNALESALSAPTVQIPLSRPGACAVGTGHVDKHPHECVLLSDLLTGADVMANLLHNLGELGEIENHRKG